MSCGCSFESYIDDCDPVDSYEEGRTNKTRSPHRCCECGETIPVGSRCCYIKFLVSGSGWETMRRCVDCSGLSEILSMKYKVCPNFGVLSEFCADYGFDFWEWRKKLKSDAIEAAERQVEPK